MIDDSKNKSIRKRWSSEEINILKESYNHYPKEVICLLLDRSWSSITSKAGELKLTKPPSSQEDKNRYSQEPKLCINCNSPLPFDKRGNKFCDHSCSITHSNKSRAKPKYCQYCGIKIFKRNSYCDRCISNRVYNTNKSSTECKSGSSLRSYILRTRTYECCRCGLSEWDKHKLSLEVHHKDGNSDNNSEENIELLCPNCHSLTDNFKALNKGNGRYIRRKNTV